MGRCQRYFEKGSWGLNGYISSSLNNMQVLLPYQVTKRATPTIAFTVTSSALASGVVSAVDEYKYSTQANTDGTGTGNGVASGNFTASAEL